MPKLGTERMQIVNLSKTMCIPSDIIPKAQACFTRMNEIYNKAFHKIRRDEPNKFNTYDFMLFAEQIFAMQAFYHGCKGSKKLDEIANKAKKLYQYTAKKLLKYDDIEERISRNQISSDELDLMRCAECYKNVHEKIRPYTEKISPYSADVISILLATYTIYGKNLRKAATFKETLNKKVKEKYSPANMLIDTKDTMKELRKSLAKLEDELLRAIAQNPKSPMNKKFKIALKQLQIIQQQLTNLKLPRQQIKYVSDLATFVVQSFSAIFNDYIKNLKACLNVLSSPSSSFSQHIVALEKVLKLADTMTGDVTKHTQSDVNRLFSRVNNSHQAATKRIEKQQQLNKQLLKVQKATVDLAAQVDALNEKLAEYNKKHATGTKILLGLQIAALLTGVFNGVSATIDKIEMVTK